MVREELERALNSGFSAEEVETAKKGLLQARQVARNQDGISKHIGEDLSAAITYRPLMSQNIVLRTSYATLISGKGAVAAPGEAPGGRVGAEPAG